MKNVVMKRNKDTLTITVDLSQDHGPSKTGKTTVIASTLGNVSVPEDENVKIGLNIYKFPSK